MLDPNLLEIDNNSRERLKFLSNNCVKLAEYLEGVPDERHSQARWLFPEGVSRGCDTAACALGWAVQGDLLEDVVTYPYDGMKVPKLYSWEALGYKYYGVQATHSIFLDTGASRIATINKLYKEAERLCEAAKAAEPQ